MVTLLLRPRCPLSNKRELQMAKIVGTIVLAFLVLNMPRVVIGVFELSRLAILGINCISVGWEVSGLS